MISGDFNSQQGNEDLSTKFGRLKSQMEKKEMQSIKLLLMFNEADGKDSGWAVKASTTHGAKMIEILKSYYRVPSPENPVFPG